MRLFFDNSRGLCYDNHCENRRAAGSSFPGRPGKTVGIRLARGVRRSSAGAYFQKQKVR